MAVSQELHEQCWRETFACVSALLCSALCTLAVSEAADLQAAVHRDETGGEQRADAKHEALDAVAEAARLSKHPGVTQADGDRVGI